MPKAILFDLDQTLLDTSPLDPYKKQVQAAGNVKGKWRIVLQNLEKAKSFDLGDSLRPDQLPRAFKKMGYKVAVVTSSIEAYAQALLDNFNIAHDALVAWHDTEEHKPLAAPLLRALELLGASPSDAISVGDEWKDTHAAHRTGIISVGAAWGVQDWNSFASAAPDVTLHKPSLLLNPELLPGRGYIGELAVAGAECHSHRGSLVWLGPKRTTGFCLGRYYPKDDPRHDSSAWSERILDFKQGAANNGFIADTLIAALDGANLWKRCPYLVCVPPKPGQANRFARVLKLISEQVGDKIKVLGDGLECIKDYGSIKAMNAEERRDAVKGAFKSSYDWKGLPVLLFDDVYTTAATTNECIATLESSNAGEVLVAALGKDQSAMEHKERKLCPACGRKMKVCTRGRDGTKFWGCSGYWDKQNQCHHTEEMDPAVA